jgi:hypothetical protein
MRILITGVRAPVALDLARRLHRAGHDVFAGDSLRFALTGRSRSVKQSCRLPRPFDSVSTYIKGVRAAVDRHRIDLLIPTCEEIFYLSRFADELGCRLFADSFDKLAAMHNKSLFARSAGNEFAAVPETHLLESPADIDSFFETSADWVFKPVFSRFAARTLIGPAANVLQNSVPAMFQNRPDHDLKASRSAGGICQQSAWIAQRRIVGQEYSTWSIAREGTLLAHACYWSKYRAGQGAGVYFLPVRHERIEAFVQAFIHQHQFTGQIGFDLIESQNGHLFAIEANPRATSGLALFADSDPLAELIVDPERLTSDVVRPSDSSPVMVEFAMPLWGLADAFRRGLLRELPADLLTARWLVTSLRDPLPALWLPVSLIELMSNALWRKVSLIEATTWDFEWNGGAM